MLHDEPFPGKILQYFTYLRGFMGLGDIFNNGYVHIFVALFHKLNVPSSSVAMSKLMYPPLETKSSVNGCDKKTEKDKAHNLLTVKWAHAINCQQLLDEALNGKQKKRKVFILLKIFFKFR